MNKKLSPEAQAVLATLEEVSWDWASMQPSSPCDISAATLRTAADQVTPSNYESFTGHAEWDQAMEARNDAIRESLLALADELDGGTQ